MTFFCFTYNEPTVVLWNSFAFFNFKFDFFWNFIFIISNCRHEAWVCSRVAVTTNETGESTTSKSLIDHFSTNRAKYIVKSGVLEQGMVDHYMIYAVRKIMLGGSEEKSKNHRVSCPKKLL